MTALPVYPVMTSSSVDKGHVAQDRTAHGQ